MALDFYHGHGSHYSWRVWLALELKHAPRPAMMEWAKRIEAMAFFDKTFPPHWK